MPDRSFDYLQLVIRHQAALFGYVRSLAPGLEIEDVLQEINIVLWEKAADFQVGTNFKAFAFRIAHLKTLETLRKEKRRNWLVFDNELIATLGEQSVVEETHDSDVSQSALGDCMASLSNEERELLHRRYTLHHSVRDIARMLSVTEGSLQQSFFRIRNALRECIERRILMERSEA